MPQKEMPKEVPIMGGCPLFAMPGPATYLAQGEKMLKTLEARKAHKPGKLMAKGKKGRVRAALRHLWSKTKSFGLCRPRLGSRHRGPFHYTAPARRPQRSGESGGALRQLPSKEKKG